MPTPTKGPRLGGGPAHERMLIANLARALFAEGRIRTTEAKAKRLRPQAERLITFAKRGDVAARRQVLTVVRDKEVVHKLFAEIAPRYADRNGGYTRILKLGPPPGAATSRRPKRSTPPWPARAPRTRSARPCPPTPRSRRASPPPANRTRPAR